MKLTVDEYLQTPESVRPKELIWGRVREPAAPRWGHQMVVTHLGALLDLHVRERGLGKVCVSPVDVVLDDQAALVLQPDIVFVATANLGRIRDRVWGPPDLVVEVMSRATARHDRTTKLSWYAQYGVRECWLMDVVHRSIEVVDLTTEPAPWVRYSAEVPMRSRVLPAWGATAAAIFS